jgi:FKBP-type peptidyl-prolyl cis-trans isomerase 2
VYEVLIARSAFTTAIKTMDELEVVKKDLDLYKNLYSYLQKESSTSSTIVYDSKFDSGILSGAVGTGNFIKGFDEALQKMRVGEKAQFIIPSSIGYGANGGGAIPAYAPLYFEVTLTAAQ